MADRNVNTAAGANDDQKIDNAFAACNSGDTLYFPSKTYIVTQPHDFTSKNINIRGDGPGASQINVNASLTNVFRMGKIFTSGTALPALVGKFHVRDISFTSSRDASKYCRYLMEIQLANYFTFDNVEFQSIYGTALHLVHVEDAVFNRVRIMKCGLDINGGMEVDPGYYQINGQSKSYVSNSLNFTNCIFERNFTDPSSFTYAAAALLRNVRTTKFVACKFHGHPDIETGYTPNNLLHFFQEISPSGYPQAIGHSNQAVGCQFVYANKYAVYISDTTSNGTIMPVIVSNNTFHAPTNLLSPTTAAVYFIVVQKGAHIIDGNTFSDYAFPAAHPSYITYGGDIWMINTANNCPGTNIHNTNKTNKVKNDTTSTQTPRIGPTPISGY